MRDELNAIANPNCYMTLHIYLRCIFTTKGCVGGPSLTSALNTHLPTVVRLSGKVTDLIRVPANMQSTLFVAKYGVNEKHKSLSPYWSCSVMSLIEKTQFYTSL